MVLSAGSGLSVFQMAKAIQNAALMWVRWVAAFFFHFFLFILISCLVFTFVTIILLLLLLKVNVIALTAARCLEQIFLVSGFWCIKVLHILMLLLLKCIWDSEFSSHPSCATCCCGLTSPQLLAITEIATNNQDTVLLAKISLSFHKLCDLGQSITVFHCWQKSQLFSWCLFAELVWGNVSILVCALGPWITQKLFCRLQEGQHQLAAKVPLSLTKCSLPGHVQDADVFWICCYFTD